MEVILEDGTVVRDSASVLEKWKCDFSSLLNYQDANVSGRHESHESREQSAADPIFKERISIFEVKKSFR